MELSTLPKNKIRAVFTDLDDTLTDKGQMAAETYQSLWRLKEKGFYVAIVSGRPAGWADCLMRLWPLDAMIFENGAGLLVRCGTKIETVMLAGGKKLAEEKRALQSLFDELKAEIPHLKLAADQPYRRFDCAIDYAEDAPELTPTELDKVMARLKRERGITAKLSSIHVNYWCGTHTKVTACRHWLDTEAKTLGVKREQVVFCGDSPNDEPLFEFFDHTVGVANISKFLKSMTHTPRYITSQRGGLGFQQLAQILLS